MPSRGSAGDKLHSCRRQAFDNGLGERESTAGFGLIGARRQEALLISILFGLLSTVAAVPGAVFGQGKWRIGAVEERGECRERPSS